MINSTVVLFYRRIAFSVLALFFVGVLSYVALVIFYTVSSTWASPITLSPAQERVLSFQPQVATLESTLLKQKVDLHTAEDKYFNGIKIQVEMRRLINRLEKAQTAEVIAMSSTGSALNRLVREKVADISITEKSMRGIKDMMKTVNDELAVGLITKDQAQSRIIMLQSALNSMTDARVQLVDLTEQARQSSAGATTLKGANSTSLQALRFAQEMVQIHTTLAQVEVETDTAKLAIDQLKLAIAEGDRVLTVAKSSPYYLALRKPVTVLFIPYDNLKNAKIGAPVFNCLLQVIICTKVGSIAKVYDAEEYARHPLFKTDIKGRFAEATLTNIEAAKSNVLFIGGKPLLI